MTSFCVSQKFLELHMVDNLHCAPSWGIINNNHPVFGASSLGTSALIRVALIRVQWARVRVQGVCAWNYIIRQHSAQSPGPSTSFAFFFMICSEVCAFFVIFAILTPLMVLRPIFLRKNRFLVFSSEYLLFKRFYSFEEGYINNYIHKSDFFPDRCTIKSSTEYLNISVWG